MSVKRNSPEIVALKREIEEKSDVRPQVNDDFEKLREKIFEEVKELVSVTTLQRVWGYSSRTVENLSLHTMNILSGYMGLKDWDAFCERLHSTAMSQSQMFDIAGISTADLNSGDRLVIGWQPDRLCTLCYLGDNRFITEESVNAKLKKGDTFSCLHFELDKPLYLENLQSADGSVSGKRYGAALRHGLSTLQMKKANTPIKK